MAWPHWPNQQPWPRHQELSKHSWSTRQTPLHTNLSPPHFELWPTRQRDASQASRTWIKLTDLSLRTLPSRCHIELPFENRTKRLSACMFLVFGCCIRLVSSFTANRTGACATCCFLFQEVRCKTVPFLDVFRGDAFF